MWTVPYFFIIKNREKVTYIFYIPILDSTFMLLRIKSHGQIAMEKKYRLSVNGYFSFDLHSLNSSVDGLSSSSHFFFGYFIFRSYNFFLPFSRSMSSKVQDLLLYRNFVRILFFVHWSSFCGQLFERAANPWAWWNHQNTKFSFFISPGKI